MKYSGGASLRDLAGFRLMRAEGDGSLTDLAELPVTDQERFQKVRRFAYVDTSAQMGHSYRYGVVSETSDGYHSDPSNDVEQTRTKPAPAPNPGELQVADAPAPLPTGTP